MTSHELARKLLEMDDKEISFSIDYGDEDPCKRCFGEDVFEIINNTRDDDIVICSNGYLNN